MDNNLVLFQMLQTRMAYNSQRQAVLAQNIAQHSMPGAQSQDLKPLDFNRLAEAASGRMSMKTTNAAHQQPALPSGPYGVEKLRKPFETTPTKSSINLEEEQRKMSQNSLEYQTATNIYMKYAAMMKTAAGSR